MANNCCIEAPGLPMTKHERFSGGAHMPASRLHVQRQRRSVAAQCFMRALCPCQQSVVNRKPRLHPVQPAADNIHQVSVTSTGRRQHCSVPAATRI